VNRAIRFAINRSLVVPLGAAIALVWANRSAESYFQFATAAVGLGLRLPPRLGWRELVVIAFATSCCSTFGLFFATAVFPIGPVLTEAKAGALSTIAGALLASAAAWLLGAGRFGRIAASQTAR
jgi:hypothetical protein